ncbi:hypothetical protein HU200_027821 [Digitaria exilis]|uniref:Uncharacterized protein n=1 Tax=Digitaria exilis TaxID=1010633 RepID=A0A835BX81_9POAL|nr:hypothetical protein HU200_027821 [Digitaria exilis]CAB3471817.1 unnamed protein product [Digitaria exilis]
MAGEDVEGQKETGHGTHLEKRRADLTPEQRWYEAAKREFIRAAIADAKAFTDTTVEEIMEEYRRAGKLRRFNPDTEWMKRFARVARKHPPPEGLVPEMADYIKLLEEDEAN